MKSFQEVKTYRYENIAKVSLNHLELNLFHDDLMRRIIKIALRNLESEWGPPPAHFAFFFNGKRWEV